MKHTSLLLFTWILCTTALCAETREFQFIPFAGEPVTAILVALRDSDFVLAPASAYLGRGEYERASIFLLRRSAVFRVVSVAHSGSRAGFTLFGVAIGAMVGGGMGAAMTKTPSGDFGESFSTSLSNSFAVIVMPILGAILGGTVGYWTSAPPEPIECFSDSFDALREHAVFVDRDPEELRANR